MPRELTALLSLLALSAISGCTAAPGDSDVAATSTPTPSATHQPFCALYDQHGEEYVDAAIEGDAGTLAALSDWADDLEYNIAPGYAEVLREHLSPIRQVQSALDSGATTFDVDFTGLKSSLGTFSLGCIGELTSERFNHDSTATPD